jgi:hypothetical protein
VDWKGEKVIRTSLHSILKASLVFLVIASCAAGHILLLGQEPTTPQIKITVVPPKKQGGPVDVYKISGTVSGVKQPKEYAVVIYALAGDQWWVQPFDYQPKTSIRNEKFDTVTHGGSVYAAVLVKSGYTPDTPIQALPTVGGDVIAVDSVAGKQND